VLYASQEDSQHCCFLPEILYSAQEAFPFLWVNGEKYVFSKDVLDHGKALFLKFSNLRRFIARLTRKLQMFNEDNDYSSTIRKITGKKEKLVGMLKALDE